MHLHTAFIITMLGCACWNASNGYLKMQRYNPNATINKSE
jgi:hypothetical protein